MRGVAGGDLRRSSLMDTVTPSCLQGSVFPHWSHSGALVQDGPQFPEHGSIDLATVLTYATPELAQGSLWSCSQSVLVQEEL